MKYFILRTVPTAILLLFICSCSKLDWKGLWDDHPSIPKCDLASYTLTNYRNAPHPFLFAKTYDASGRCVTAIDASIFNIREWDLTYRYPLKVVYNGRNLYLINQDNPADTTLKVSLNKFGRPEKTPMTNDRIGWYEFYYTNNRLSSVKWGGILFECLYDQAGNILSLSYASDDHTRSGYFYKYDYTRKAKQQFYMDEIRYLDHGFTILQYLGLFPELTPVNLRIHTRMAEGASADDPENTGSRIWSQYLINHKLDASGKLLSYDLADYYNGSYSVSYSALLNWNCR